MNKKTLLQGLIVFLITLILLIFYAKYFFERNEVVKKNSVPKKNQITLNNSSTYIDDVDYVSSDNRGNKYQITAEQGEIKIENSDIMFLTNVIAYIFMEDSSTIKITSNFGKYNLKNYDTIFSENVIVTYPDHKITGEYLDFSMLKNLGTISKNVIYNGNKTNLFADRVEINLTTKDTKIFMNESNIFEDFHESKKVFVEGTK